MSDLYISSDQINKIGNRSLGYNIFERTVVIDSFTEVDTGRWLGYAYIPLSEFNISATIPEVEGSAVFVESVSSAIPGEFDYYYKYSKLPYTEIWSSTSAVGLPRRACWIETTFATEGTTKDVENPVFVSGEEPTITISYFELKVGIPLPVEIAVKIKGSDADNLSV